MRGWIRKWQWITKGNPKEKKKKKDWKERVAEFITLTEYLYKYGKRCESQQTVGDKYHSMSMKRNYQKWGIQRANITISPLDTLHQFLSLPNSLFILVKSFLAIWISTLKCDIMALTICLRLPPSLSGKKIKILLRGTLISVGDPTSQPSK